MKQRRRDGKLVLGSSHLIICGWWFDQGEAWPGARLSPKSPKSPVASSGLPSLEGPKPKNEPDAVEANNTVKATERRPETHSTQRQHEHQHQCTTNLGTENQHQHRRCNCPLFTAFAIAISHLPTVCYNSSIHTEFLTSFHSQHHPSSRPSSTVSLELRRLASPHLSFSSQHQHCLASPPSSFDSCACVTDFRVPPCPTSDLHHSTPQIAFRPASTRLDSIRLTTFLTAQALPCSPTLLTITLSLRFRVSETVYDLLKHKATSCSPPLSQPLQL